MEFDHTFEVGSPVESVWAVLLDVERVAQCVPGARILEQTDEHAYRVALKVRVGPGSTSYAGDLQLLDPDAEKHVASMQVRTREARGPGAANANIVIRLAESGEGDGTEGKVFTQLALSGRGAAAGPSGVGDASGRLIDAFARNLAAMLGHGGTGRLVVPEPEPEPELEAEPDLEPEREREPGLEGEPEPEAHPEPKAAPGPEAEPQPEPKPQPKPEPKAKAKPKPKPEPKAEAKPKPEAAPAPPPPHPADAAGDASLVSRIADPRALGAAATALLVLAIWRARARR